MFRRNRNKYYEMPKKLWLYKTIRPELKDISRNLPEKGSSKDIYKSLQCDMYTVDFRIKGKYLWVKTVHQLRDEFERFVHLRYAPKEVLDYGLNGLSTKLADVFCQLVYDKCFDNEDKIKKSGYNSVVTVANIDTFGRTYALCKFYFGVEGRPKRKYCKPCKDRLTLRGTIKFCYPKVTK